MNEVGESQGGAVFSGDHWTVEHCVGPLGVGTLIVKPLRHCTSVAELNAAEASELGSLLKDTAECVQTLNDADQVYVCLWSHAQWSPVHIHFVVQPAWNAQQGSFSGPGPTLQSEMFRAKVVPPRREVIAFCDLARTHMRQNRSQPSHPPSSSQAESGSSTIDRVESQRLPARGESKRRAQGAVREPS